jgi:hypothetical protein
MDATWNALDPAWRLLYCGRFAQEGDLFDLVLDVRPRKARCAKPYPAACIQIFADDLLADLRWLDVGFPSESCRICCVCWTGLRAVRCAFHLVTQGWNAFWWAMSPTARHAMEN